MTTEAEVTPEVITAARSQYGATMLRNNSGALKDKFGRPVRFGLGNTSPHIPYKSSDYIGVRPVVITQEMVGQTLGVACAIELKKSDWKFNPNDEREVYQKRFIDWFKSLGCFAGFAKSVDDLRDIFRT